MTSPPPTRAQPERGGPLRARRRAGDRPFSSCCSASGASSRPRGISSGTPTPAGWAAAVLAESSRSLASPSSSTGCCTCGRRGLAAAPPASSQPRERRGREHGPGRARGVRRLPLPVLPAAGRDQRGRGLDHFHRPGRAGDRHVAAPAPRRRGGRAASANVGRRASPPPALIIVVGSAGGSYPPGPGAAPGRRAARAPRRVTGHPQDETWPASRRRWRGCARSR